MCKSWYKIGQIGHLEGQFCRCKRQLHTVNDMPSNVNLTYQVFQDFDILYAAQDNEKGNSTTVELSDLLYRENRFALSSLLNYHAFQLSLLEPASFKYLSAHEKKVLHKQLAFTIYLFNLQLQIDAAEKRKKAYSGSVDAINQCLHLLRALDFAETHEISVAKTKEKDYERELDDYKYNNAIEDYYLKYLGLTILAPWLKDRIMECIDGNVRVAEEQQSGIAPGKKTTLLKKWMTDINNRRLYWVWGGGMLATALELLAFDQILPADKINSAKNHLSAPSTFTGYMSWVLYYARFGLNTLLLIQHTFFPTDKEEIAQSRYERFRTQWNQRKFTLLNDSIWATANLACFFWLKGSGTMGYTGNVLTAALLLMDLTLTIILFLEESTKYNKEMEGFIKRKEELNLALRQAKMDNNQDAIKNLTLELAQLNKTIRECELNWKYKKATLITSIAYAAGLLFSFCLFSAFFVKSSLLTPVATMSLSFAGAGLCFAFTFLYAAATGAIDIAKTTATKKVLENDALELMKLFLKAPDEPTKKQLFYEMKGLMAETAYQEALIRHQVRKLVRSILVDSLVPALVFGALLFMPFGFGLAAMAVGLLVAVLTHVILQKMEPKHEEFKEKDVYELEQQYYVFDKKMRDKSEADATLEDLKLLKHEVSKKQDGFFKSNYQTGGYVHTGDGWSPEPWALATGMMPEGGGAG